MISILASIALVHTYGYKPSQVERFKVKVELEGWIPLFGGREGTSTVDMLVEARVKGVSTDGTISMESEIIEMSASAFGAKLPLNSSNIGQFFPKAVVEFSPVGKVLKNSAPAIKMPVQLPGLDSQRLPEISYLPIELGSDKYEFVRTFNGNKMTYVVLADGEDYKFALAQKSTGFEDAYGNPAEEADAKAGVTTELRGEGEAEFNTTSGFFSKVSVKTTAVSDVKPFGNRPAVKRTLTTKLTILHQADRNK
ncbi:MAG TPA: hypothetical protein VK171_09245 [Fimbriimonas sp.]|nr:hypothetical protein [Fimbriimonas sp.]